VAARTALKSPKTGAAFLVRIVLDEDDTATASCHSPLKTKPAVLNKPNPRRMGLKIRETFRFC